jgi:hypothetical protein
MYAILAEDSNDVECLKVLIKRLKNDKSLSIKGKGFGGCAKMLKDGKKQLDTYKALGFNRFIICYDKDKSTDNMRYNEIVASIIKPSKIQKTDKICILIPTEEIEAWILSDLTSISKVISSWKPSETYAQPEHIKNPKEKLTKLSETKNSKPLYIHTIHNSLVFEHINLDAIKKKCPSFIELSKFIENEEANYPKK